MKDNPNYNFHAKCEKMKIINLYFNDDFLLFFRGDIGSIKLIMETMKEFYVAAGLNMSIPKSKVYFGRVVENIQRRIIQETGFDIRQLPFKYLGVPLDNKKLSLKNCQPLIARILVRFNHWSTRLLSYAGRYLLIKSVIFSIANYWMQIFPLPKRIIEHIEVLCIRFIWTGKDRLA